MSADWKAGDVAVTPRGDRLFRHGDKWITESPGFNGSKVAANHETEGARRLVVIDPTDGDAVVALHDAYLSNTQEGRADIVALSLALREFANPTPRIEEPQGLGAVVEDADGTRHVRSHTSSFGGPWTTPGVSGTRTFLATKAVRVLSEGVTA